MYVWMPMMLASSITSITSCRGRAVAEGVLDVQPQAGHVEMGGRGVERDVDELLDLWLERSVRPRHRREVDVGLEEVGVELQQLVPERVPVASLLLNSASAAPAVGQLW